MTAVSPGPVVVLVGRAVHRQHLLFGECVVEHREDRSFDLSGVALHDESVVWTSCRVWDSS